MGMQGWFAALAGYLFTYYNSKSLEERKARIDRVNLQLRSFYGPLLACVTATKSAYVAMVKQHSPDGTPQGLQQSLTQDPDGPTAVAYRMWMTKVLQPLNERAAAITTDNIDLLEGSTIEPLLLKLVAHVYANRVILEQWSRGDNSSYSVISYPNAIVEYVQQDFAKMKRTQAELLGTRRNVFFRSRL